MEKRVLSKLLIVCEAWGECIARQYFPPELALKYNTSIICESSLGVFTRKYRIVQVDENTSLKKLIKYKCTCLLCQEHLLERGIPMPLDKEYMDDDDPDVHEHTEPQIIIIAHLRT